ncbi:expressed unknown protein [Seminavis robusta]|uniref:Uncharacterized protein n=1 Tax=Seminavis robusta TaxID=568900 RepID=A0A9N8HSC0_9STRA|nr:expressed unknown protein [Seminavis robusta]|eukprot:Sro1366_g266690.1 n/a (216) ;mRNA; r:21530-22177
MQQRCSISSRGPSPLERATSCPAIICHSTRTPLIEDTDESLPTSTTPTRLERRHSFDGFSTPDDSSAQNDVAAADEAAAAAESSRFRKARVAITGGTLTAVGLVMIPLPIPMGFVVATAGMAHLGQEFPAAQRMLDHTKERVVEAWTTTTTTTTTTTKQKEDTNTSRTPQKKPNDTLVESPTSIRAVWELDDDETIMFDSPGFQEEDVMVNVWQA